LQPDCSASENPYIETKLHISIMPSYDIIGDIHGHADALKRLLQELGYQAYDSNPYCYHHPRGRKVIFLGDYIDRGPAVLEVLRIVHAMTAAGEARAIMGNHEFNMIGYCTYDSWGEQPLRPHTDKNRRQVAATFEQVEAEGLSAQAWHEWIQWMRQLPLWLEAPGFRAVHAAWDFNAVQFLRRQLMPDHSIGGEDTLLAAAWQKGDDEHHPSPVYSAVELLLKGREIKLPRDAQGRQITYTDKEGHPRDNIRTRWWEPYHGQTYTTAAFPPQASVQDQQLPTVYLDAHFGYPAGEPPVFVGHYWLNLLQTTIELAPLAENVACLDYSVAKQGYLVAYRWDGEQVLQSNRFVQVPYAMRANEPAEREV
jgi:hypothetical protein